MNITTKSLDLKPRLRPRVMRVSILSVSALISAASLLLSLGSLTNVPEPVFVTNGVRLAAAPRRVGAKGDHLQLAITDNTASVRCIAFGMGKLEKKLLEREFFNVAYQPQINTYNGSDNVQLVLTDMQFD